jgi:uncharacterized membrane protein
MALAETVTGLILFLFAVTVPGYFLALAFFPSKKEIDLLERLAFSLLFSISFLALAVLFENQLLGIPLNFFSVAATLFGLIAVGLIVFMIRSQRVQVPVQVYWLFPKIEKNDAAGIIPELK